MLTPEPLPITGSVRLKRPHSGKNGTRVGPWAHVFQQSGALGIAQHILRDHGKGAALPLIGPQYMVVSLTLQRIPRRKPCVPVAPKPRRRPPLVGASIQTNPKKVSVIGHQAVSGAGQVVAVAGMQQQLAHDRMVSVIQPARGAGLHCHAPVYARMALVGGGREPWQAVMLGLRLLHKNHPNPPPVRSQEKNESASALPLRPPPSP